jgi:hypothetical protein
VFSAGVPGHRKKPPKGKDPRRRPAERPAGNCHVGRFLPRGCGVRFLLHGIYSFLQKTKSRLCPTRSFFQSALPLRCNPLLRLSGGGYMHKGRTDKSYSELNTAASHLLPSANATIYYQLLLHSLHSTCQILIEVFSGQARPVDDHRGARNFECPTVVGMNRGKLLRHPGRTATPHTSPHSSTAP